MEYLKTFDCTYATHVTVKSYQIMDPLEKLAEKNRKHSVQEKKERNNNLKYYPFAVLFLTLYVGGYYLYFSFM